MSDSSKTETPALGRKRGSNSKYKRTYPEIAREVLNKGGLRCHVASKLGVDRDTVDRWMKDPRKPKFRQAMIEGLMASEAFHASRYMDIATGKIRGSEQAQYRILKWAFGWKDIQTTEDISEVTTLSDEDLQKKLAMYANVVSITDKKKGNG